MKVDVEEEDEVKPYKPWRERIQPLWKQNQAHQAIIHQLELTQSLDEWRLKAAGVSSFQLLHD